MKNESKPKRGLRRNLNVYEEKADIVKFENGSKISLVPSNEVVRGKRSEEYTTIN